MRIVIRTILILMFMAVLFTCILGVDRVNGNSMYPYLNHGDWIVYSRLPGEIRRNEVVVFEKTGENLVKRVAGLPGDTVEISPSGDRVVINGEEMRETYVTLTGREVRRDGGEDKAGSSDGVLMKVMDGQYVVLGDNRSVSIDSRDRGMGTVPEADILGTVVLVFRINKNGT